MDLGLQFQIFPFFHCIFRTSDWSVLVNPVLTQFICTLEEYLGIWYLHCQWLIWFLSLPAYIFINNLVAAKHRPFVYASSKSGVVDYMMSMCIKTEVFYHIWFVIWQTIRKKRVKEVPQQVSMIKL